jgi:hypothetical protein
VFKVIEPAAQVVLNHTSEGVTGPLGTVLLVFWVLATSLTLVIRPSRAVRVLGAETLLRESPDPAR